MLCAASGLVGSVTVQRLASVPSHRFDSGSCTVFFLFFGEERDVPFKLTELTFVLAEGTSEFGGIKALAEFQH